ncbi:MAG: D-sedoheptulose 7-phosphate isomerase [Luminiphilus sp.]|nr:D-sedoheptulose 7-phosphate isomerase [Luminiphilus sp.]
MQEFIDSYIARHQAVLAQLAGGASDIEAMAHTCITALESGHKLLICGNGGSAADAQHMAAELVGRFIADRPALAAIALTTDTSALTAIANDYGYDDVFSRQVAGLANSGDVLLAISTSGQSASVLAACKTAHSLGCSVLGLSGRDGGALNEACDASVVAPATETAHIQECHIVVIHLLCALIEKGLGLA